MLYPELSAKALNCSAWKRKIARVRQLPATPQEKAHRRPCDRNFTVSPATLRAAAKCEQVGNANYPEVARTQKLYGSLVLTVGIRRTVASNDRDRPRIGQKVLDAAALKIVELAVMLLFHRISRSDTDILYITRTWASPVPVNWKAPAGSLPKSAMTTTSHDRGRYAVFGNPIAQQRAHVFTRCSPQRRTAHRLRGASVPAAGRIHGRSRALSRQRRCRRQCHRAVQTGCVRAGGAMRHCARPGWNCRQLSHVAW